MPTKHAKNPPRPGTFAAWVVAQSIDETPAELARRARSLKWPRAKAQTVSGVRWYYGLSRGAGTTGTAAPSSGAAQYAARIAAARVRAGASAAATGAPGYDRPPPEHAELVDVITRYGTDAALRVINRIEAHGRALERAVLAERATAPARRSA